MNLSLPNSDKSLWSCRSIVFDVDGTLVHSEPVIQKTAFETIKTYLNDDVIESFEQHIPAMKEECFGFSEDIFSSKILNYLSSRAMLNTSISSVSDREFFARFAGDRSDRWKTFCSLGMVKPLPGAVAFVMQAYERFGPLALNTGSPEALSKPMLELALGKELDVNKIFPFSLRTHSSDLPQGLGKPNPDGYTRAAALLRIPPWELMAVVDRGNDCISALRAGYGRVVIVPENGDTAPLYSPGGKHSLTSFLSIMPESDRLEVQKRVVVIDTLEGFSLD